MEAISHEDAWKRYCIRTINLALDRASPEKVSAIRCFVAHYIKGEYDAGLASMDHRDSE